LLTEVNPLAYPDNALIAGDNIDILRNGSAKRRRALDIEGAGLFSTSTWAESVIEQSAISVHEWSSVDGDATLNFHVIQVGGTLLFHRSGEDVLSLSIMGKIDLAPIRTHEDFYKEPIDSDSGKGKLFIVGKYISPAYIEYDKETNTFRGVKLTLKIRDIDGIPEDTEAPEVFGDTVTPPPDDDLNLPDYTDILDLINNPGDFAPYIIIEVPHI
jgi:hypothetical protein